MGIPQLYRYLASSHPRAVRTLHPGGAPLLRCDHLYLDFNSIVHGSAHALRARSPPLQLDADAVIQETMRQTARIVALVQPQDLVYIAVDGLPPMGKLHQQRHRRYLAVHRSAQEAVDDGWDSNVVTPGTDFMRRLSAELQQRAAGVAPCRVVVSDADEDGEGEQKIFRELRTAPPTQRSVVYGLDADLLLMALLNPARDSIKVLREASLEAGSQMQCVDIGALARGVSSSLAHPSDGRLPGELGALDADAVMATRLRDFVTLCLLLGNDFMPPLPSLRIRDGAPDALLRAYRRALDAAGGRRLSRGGADVAGGIDLGLLASVLGAVADEEESAIGRMDHRYYHRCGATSRSRLSSSETVEMHPVVHPFPDTVRPGTHGWRCRYYRHIMGFAQAQVSHMHAAAVSYVAAMVWTLCYMEQRCLSTGFYYPYAYAPLAMDVRNALMDATLSAGLHSVMSVDLPKPPAHAATKGEWQLLLVLPRASRHLLPPHLRDIMTTGTLGCAHMYPTTWKTTAYLKDWLHECSPCLPYLDIPLLLRATQSAGAAARG
jgi:5'-3' exonuclease